MTGAHDSVGRSAGPGADRDDRSADLEAEMAAVAEFFDAEFYAAAQPGVAARTDDLLRHFCRDGWRELKIALFQVRPPGEPAGPAGWSARELPAPTASAAYASTSDCDRFAATWRPRAEGLGIDPDGPMTVLADGAAWIWRAAGERFGSAAGVLDIFHASQHIAAAAAALHGEGTPEAADWLDGCRGRLLADGWPGLLDHVGAMADGAMTTAGRAASDEMIGYFAAHTGRLGYFGRLRAGRSIGSGAVEGVARRLGRRLKVPGRGWCAGNIDGMATLILTVDTPEWDGLWSRPAA